MKKILTLLLCTVVLCACSNDDSNENSPGNGRIQGRWNLNSYIAFVDVLPVLERGDVTWTFNEAGTRLVVRNAVQDAYPYMLASGTYDVTAADGHLSIMNGGFESEYEYDFTDGILTLRDTQDSGDGPHMQFSRN